MGRGHDRPESIIDPALMEMKAEKIIDRLWEHDHTIWKPRPDDITNRLGWLELPSSMSTHLPRIEEFVRKVRDDGYESVLLLGMGGSSLAPEVFRKVFGVAEGFPDLSVLDSTHPQAVRDRLGRIDFGKTLFLVSTKSGGTVETLSLMKFFYNRALNEIGESNVGKHFAAVTDPGSNLEKLAHELEFRDVFLNDPNIGGRYSALSFFGLVPAALVGIDTGEILERGGTMAEACRGSDDNPGALLGVTMGEMAANGRDKLTLVLSKSIAPLGAWIEQLIAESTGKEGKGILPVIEERLGGPELYSDDRLFVEISLKDDSTSDQKLETLSQNGHPVFRLQLEDIYDLGKEFFRWEMATAIAGWRLGINAFDQPNVEAAKVQARKMIEEFKAEGRLKQSSPVLTDDGIDVFSDITGKSAGEIFLKFLDSADRAGSDKKPYVALQAYLNPSGQLDEVLLELKTRIRKMRRLAVTSGYGPRFLHSTGQLHKGNGEGLFIQLTDDAAHDLSIPDEVGKADSSVDFGTLITAQVLGDARALAEAGRRVIRFNLGDDAVGGVKKLMDALEESWK
jgi:transaldolase/glucose-6-phosphate isomerase